MREIKIISVHSVNVETNYSACPGVDFFTCSVTVCIPCSYTGTFKYKHYLYLHFHGVNCCRIFISLHLISYYQIYMRLHLYIDTFIFTTVTVSHSFTFSLQQQLICYTNASYCRLSGTNSIAFADFCTF